MSDIYELQQPSPHQSGADQSGTQEGQLPSVRDTIDPATVGDKAFECKEALMIRPYYLDMKTQKLNDSYPTLSKLLEQGAYPTTERLLAAEGDGEMEAPQMIQTDPAESEEPPMEPGADVSPAGDDAGTREATKAANMEKLGIATPEEFAAKFKGKLEELGEEHGIGDPLAYSFRTNKIELIGTEAILLIDYDMNALHTRPMYPIEESEPATPPEEGGEGEPAAPPAEDSGE
jgi:hypothetical protein